MRSTGHGTAILAGSLWLLGVFAAGGGGTPVRFVRENIVVTTHRASFEVDGVYEYLNAPRPDGLLYLILLVPLLALAARLAKLPEAERSTASRVMTIIGFACHDGLTPGSAPESGPVKLWHTTQTVPSTAKWGWVTGSTTSAGGQRSLREDSRFDSSPPSDERPRPRFLCPRVRRWRPSRGAPKSGDPLCPAGSQFRLDPLWREAPGVPHPGPAFRSWHMASRRGWLRELMVRGSGA